MHYTSRLILFCTLPLLPFVASAQGFDWWNKKHNWDGVTHWHKYLRLAPAYMGPNALPVPFVEKGQLPESFLLKTGLALHYGKGDQTQNMESSFYLPLYSPRAGLRISMVPLEHYRTDTLTRDLRRARNFEGDGWAVGDVYIGTLVQLLTETDRQPGISLSINLKTASGNRLSDARYTDTPGYYFNAAFGKNITLPGRIISSIRSYLNMGFYVWQTFGDEHYQNDAVFYGAGLDLNLKWGIVQQNLAGYSGYIGNGDRPVVYRVSFVTQSNKSLDYVIGWQIGLRDYPFNSYRMGLIFNKK